jgi:nicotinamide riboside kinase
MQLIFTGTESTFKTALSKAVATALDWPLSSEYAREYIAKLLVEQPYLDMHHFTKESFLACAIGQLERQEQMGYYSDENAVFDTDGVTLAIWGVDKFDGAEEQWLTPPKNGLYLLCAPTNAASEDPQRIDTERREFLHGQYIQWLEKLGREYIVLTSESFEERLTETLQHLAARGIR